MRQKETANSITVSLRNYKKAEREKRVLFGVIELYIATGKPVGSQTLTENGFQDLSSATIRNYFSKLEKEGLLVQQHSSGGRVPTDEAFQQYAAYYQEYIETDFAIEKDFAEIRNQETLQISSYLQQSATLLSKVTGYAVFLSAPRFDQDFVQDIKLVVISSSRCLAVLLTHFGIIRTEQLYLEQKLTIVSLKKVENYFDFRLKGIPLPPEVSEEEIRLGQTLYNEIMMRYLVSYSYFSQEDMYRTGFSQLLAYPEFNQATTLVGGLALFENVQALQSIIKQAMAKPEVSIWIGGQLKSFMPEAAHCSILAIPYKVGQSTVGVIGLLGPVRMPYRQLFKYLKVGSRLISESLTQNVYQFKIQFREAKLKASVYLGNENRFSIESQKLQISDQTIKDA
ncbi:MAG: hrcA [Chlamydiales bacterium]|nr:hrcA [Chlamydiales bacterium]